MTKNKCNDVILSLPQKTIFSYDDLLATFLPTGRGQRQPYIHTSIIVFWQYFHPGRFPPSMAEMVKMLSEKFNTTQSSVILQAITFHAGRDSAANSE